MSLKKCGKGLSVFLKDTFKLGWIVIRKAVLTLLNEKASPVRQNERDVWMAVVDDRGREELMRNEEARTR